MRRFGMVLSCVVLLTVVGPAGAVPRATGERADRDDQTRFSLANGCYALRAESGRFVTKSGDGYSATAGSVAQAEPFRMQATRLGSYLFYGRGRDFMAASSDGAREIKPAPDPSEAADWEVLGNSRGFTIRLPQRGAGVATSKTGELVLGDAAPVGFVRATGCATYPEAAVNAVGEPLKGRPGYGEVTGFLDSHAHLMIFEGGGGKLHCGRPWHPYGVTHALGDCSDAYGPAGTLAPYQNTFDYGTPVRPRDTRGWPTFKEWPRHDVLSTEGVYYKWLERTWRSGLRLVVALNTDLQIVCEVAPQRQHECGEMASVRRQIADNYALQDYIDAQSGGPGKGWFRIVTDPFEARRVINSGKLAVVLGIETSKLFECGVFNEVPQCNRAQVDGRLAEMHRLGVRQMEVVNKVDNAFTGVAGDEGTTGVLTNTANFRETGKFWAMETCSGEGHDKPQTQSPTHTHTTDIGLALNGLLEPGRVPIYPRAPHCNRVGLTELGEHLVRRMMQRGMLIDPDHMSVRGRSQALTLAEANDYPGVLSSHSWSDNEAYPRVHRAGGVVTPIGGDSAEYVRDWRSNKQLRNERFFSGFGVGSDINGVHKSGGPRQGNEKNPVRYPFKSLDGAVTLGRQRSGERVFDYNTEGVAHYGLYADWMEDVRILAGPKIAKEMRGAAESYLQMWERASGVPGPRCRYARGAFKQRGLSWARVGFAPRQLLARAGQPQRRKRAWTYCVRGRTGRNAKVVAVFTSRGKVGLVGSTGRGHEALHISRGSSARKLRGARRVGRTLFVKRIGRRRAVYGVRRGRVRFAAVTTRSITGSPRLLRRYVRLAGLH